jgi:membrane associated rhomboid family serine protease
MYPIRDHNPTSGPVFVVWALLAANVAAFALAWLPGRDASVLAWAMRYGLVARDFLAEPFAAAPTLVTHLFSHGSWEHLIGNMVFLFVFGDNVEDRFGHARFAAFYLAGGFVAAAAQLVADPHSPLPLVGASGAVSAVLGAYIVLYPRKTVQSVVLPLLMPWFFLRIFLAVPRFFLWSFPAWVYLGYWIVIQVLSGVATPPNVEGGVAWWAHVGGFAFGAGVSRWLAR